MEKWNTVEDIPLSFHKDSLIDDKNGFFLNFEGRLDTKKFSVVFDKGVLSYRNIDEGSLLM